MSLNRSNLDTLVAEFGLDRDCCVHDVVEAVKHKLLRAADDERRRVLDIVKETGPCGRHPMGAYIFPLNDGRGANGCTGCAREEENMRWLLEDIQESKIKRNETFDAIVTKIKARIKSGDTDEGVSIYGDISV